MFRPLFTFSCLIVCLCSYYLVAAQEFLADESFKLTTIAADSHYGYEATYANSIKVGTDENIVSFLRALRGPNGEKVTFSRIGSCCGYEVPGSPGKVAALARWAVTYPGLQQPITLYLNKNIYENPLCPVGFTFATPATVVMPRLFPADSIHRVQPCLAKPYAVNDPLLKEALALDTPQPDSLPHFSGGINPLKAFLPLIQ